MAEDGLQPRAALPLDYAGLPSRGRRRLLIACLTAFGVALGLIGASGVLVPSLHSRREHPAWVRCASNLRQVSQGVQMYANENHGLFPPDFETLLLTQDLTSEVFVCYCTNHERATGPTTQAVAEQLSAGGHLSYVYTGRGMDWQTPRGAVLAYEPLANHGDGANVLFADGHVEWLDAAHMTALQAELAAGHNPPRPDRMK